MVAAVVLLALGQSAMTAEQIHAEDSAVLETALVSFWKANKPEKTPIYISDLVEGTPDRDRLLRRIISDQYREKPLAIEDDLRDSYVNRNAWNVSIEWFKPKDPLLKTFSHKEKRRPNDELSYREWKQYSWPLMPGYSKDRTKAIVCFGFNWSIHSGDVTLLLKKTDTGWTVTDVRKVFYV